MSAWPQPGGLARGPRACAHSLALGIAELVPEAVPLFDESCDGREDRARTREALAVVAPLAVFAGLAALCALLRAAGRWLWRGLSGDSTWYRGLGLCSPGYASAQQHIYFRPKTSRLYRVVLSDLGRGRRPINRWWL